MILAPERRDAEQSYIAAIADSYNLDDIEEALAWIEQHCRVPANTESPGPFDLSVAPHVAEPIQTITGFETQEIIMDWATRNCKTFTAIFLIVYWVKNFAAPCGIASHSLNLRDKVIDDKLYPALDACAETAGLLAPTHLRSSDQVSVGSATIETAIAGSKATLASFPAQFAMANEVGLWPMNSIKRLRDRLKNFGSFYKLVFEGKPEDKATCTITKLANQPDVQRRVRHIQCPKCKTWQPLVWGYGEPGAGVKWLKKNGRSTAAHAMKTCYYECERGCKIKDGEQRRQVLLAGKWVPEGCRVTKRGRIMGKPDVESTRRVAFVKLSSLYSLLVDGWSQIVGEWFDCKDDIELRREFVTGTLGEPYDPRPQSRIPEKIALRLSRPIPYGTAPTWSRFPTIVVDVGHDMQTDELEYWWAVVAWGTVGKKVRGHWVSEGHFGFGETDDLIDWICNCQVPHADGGVLVPRGRCIAIDSGDGNVSEKVVLLTELITERFKETTHAVCLPLKGDSRKSNKLNWFTWGDEGSTQEEREINRLSANGNLVLVNTERSQSWRENLISGRLIESDRDFVSLPEEYGTDWTSYEDTLMEFAADHRDEKGRWKRIGKNERGDLLRYSRVMASVRTFSDTTWAKVSRNPADRTRRQTTFAPPTELEVIETFVGDGELKSLRDLIKGLEHGE